MVIFNSPGPLRFARLCHVPRPGYDGTGSKSIAAFSPCRFSESQFRPGGMWKSENGKRFSEVHPYENYIELYPLVNIQKTIENHLFKWEIHYIWLVVQCAHLKNDGVRQWEGWHPIYEMENNPAMSNQPNIEFLTTLDGCVMMCFLYVFCGCEKRLLILW